MCAIGEPRGPIENGTTYIVRPRMQPSKSAGVPSAWPSCSTRRISAGAIQWLVGPASSGCSEQMKVRSSTRATSLGSLSARKLFGRLASFKRRKVPAATSSAHRRSYSAWLPSHQWMRSGWARAAMSDTQASSRAFFT